MPGVYSINGIYGIYPVLSHILFPSIYLPPLLPIIIPSGSHPFVHGMMRWYVCIVPPARNAIDAEIISSNTTP